RPRGVSPPRASKPPRPSRSSTSRESKRIAITQTCQAASPVYDAYAKEEEPCSVVVSSRSVLAVHTAALKPKVFMPLHHDACGYLTKKNLATFLPGRPDPRPMFSF